MKISFVVVALLFSTLAPTVAFGSSEASRAEVIKNLLTPCTAHLKSEPQSDLRRELARRLTLYIQKTNSKIELLQTQLEGILAEELKTLGGPFYMAPSIEPKTMAVLLRVYGSEAQISFRQRLDAFSQVIPALLNDSYFSWLDQKSKIDPIAFFIKPLESSGSEHLGLNLSLLRLRAALDPSFPKKTAAAVPLILYMHARANLASHDLMRLKLSDDGTENLRELIEKLWGVSELGLFNEHYNAVFEGLKHRYPYLDFEHS